MPFRTIHVSLLFGDEPVAEAALNYALALCDQDKAHLTVCLGAMSLSIPSGHSLPLVEALESEVNGERLAKAEAMQARVETRARLAGVIVDCHVSMKAFHQLRDDFV